MHTHARTVLLMLHGIGLIACLALWAHSFWALPLHASMRVTDLDRSQVIDNQKLGEMWPDRAVNTRIKLARYVAGGAESQACFVAQVGALISAIGLVATWFLLPCQRRETPGKVYNRAIAIV